jgi:dihydrofolate reductase
MGRKTFETLPRMKPLKGRTNIVVSANGFNAPEGVVRCQTLEEALQFAQDKDETSFVIGGQTIYDTTIDRATKLMLTRVHVSYSYDPEKCRIFPYIDHSIWKRSFEKNCGAFSFVDYARIQPSG